MNTNKSHNVELSEKEFQLIEALKQNPEMLDEFTAVTEEFNAEVDNGMDAYEAECHIIKSIQEIGRSMMTKWAKQAQQTAVSDATSTSEIIKNGKKNSTGIAHSEESALKPK